MSEAKTIQKSIVKHAIGERVRYRASLILQSGKQFYSITMPTNILAECCYVTSRDEDPVAGFQRVLDKKRAQDIAKYIALSKAQFLVLSFFPLSPAQIFNWSEEVKPLNLHLVKNLLGS